MIRVDERNRPTERPNLPKALFWSPANLPALNRRFEDAHPVDILRWGATTYHDDIVLAIGFGVGGISLLHMMVEAGLRPQAFYLETDLLFAETYALRDRLQERLCVAIRPISAAMSLDDQNATFGRNLWQRSTESCCAIRKVSPMRWFLADQKAWITGIRRDQSATRANARIVSWDHSNQLVKVAPLATWSRADVWRYVLAHDLPYNPLHDRGYQSVGCAPCTIASTGSDERAGRWAGQAKVECGIHV